MEKKQRMTVQKKVIIDTLKSVKTHPTADELYSMVREKLPKVSLGTIYRNLELLSEQGLIRKLDLSGPQKRFDGDTSEHYHITCTQCGKVGDIFMHEMEISPSVQRHTDFKVTGHNLEVMGVCSHCQKKNRH